MVRCFDEEKIILWKGEADMCTGNWLCKGKKAAGMYTGKLEKPMKNVTDKPKENHFVC